MKFGLQGLQGRKFDLRDMEHIMAAHVFGQIQFYQISDDRERTHPFGHEFLFLTLRKVMCAQKHELNWVACNLWTVLIIVSLLPVLCGLKRFPSRIQSLLRVCTNLAEWYDRF